MMNSKRMVLAMALAAVGAGAMGAVSAQSTDQSTSQAPAQSAAATPGAHHGPGFGPGRGGPGHFHHPGGPGGFVGTLLHAVQQAGKANAAVALTAQQKQQITALVRAGFKAEAGKAAVDITVTGNPGSSGFAGAVQAAQTQAANRVLAESALAQSIYQTVLTPAQQQALPAALQALQAQQAAAKAKAEARRQARQSTHGQAPGGG